MIAAKLRGLGIYENSDGTDHSAVLGWLAQADVVSQHGRGRWSLDEQRFAALAGVGTAQVGAVARFHPVQLALMVELARNCDGESNSKTMQRLLALRDGLDVDASGFRSKYVDPLAKAGLIEVMSGRTGRGATRFRITELGRSEAIEDLTSRYEAHGQVHYPIAELLRPIGDIAADLDRTHQPDAGRRGIALELLALRLLEWIGLTHLRWRHRPTGNSEEIDGIADAELPALVRWQMQAKNTAQLDTDDAAKEAGLAVANGASIVMLITTGRFTAGALSVRDRVERRSGLTFVCLDGQDVQDIVPDPACLKSKLRRESERGAEAKREAAA